MSSKFSMSPPALRPPTVCIKPPDPPAWDFPNFHDYPFQGSMDFWAPFSPYEGGFTTAFTMTPDPPNSEWNALTGEDVAQVQIVMRENTAPRNLDFVLIGISGGIPYDNWTILGVTPRSWTPFDTGLLYPEPGPSNGYLRFRILA